MDGAERTGLGIALAGHVALLALLSLGLVSTAKLPPIRSEPIDVRFVDEVGRQSAAPASTAAPAPSEAPKVARPEEETPPEPPPPEPQPTPPKPLPAPKPAPEPTPPKAEPKPKPKPAPKPAPAKPAPAKKPAPAVAEQPAPRPAPQPAAKPAKTAAKPSAPAAAPADERGRRRPDRPEDGKAGPAKPAKAAGARLGPDFLKGLADSPKGKAETPKAASVSALQLAGLAAAIKRQVQPCYELGSLQGTPAMSIVTVLRLQFNKDGTVAAAPSVSDHSGVSDDNRGYIRQMDDVARRAVLRCAPLRLPAELFDGGWQDIEFTFRPGQMG